MNWWQIALLILAGLLLLPYVVGPFFVYRKVWFSVFPTIRRLTEPDLPAEADTFFKAAREQFERIGFHDHWGDFKVTEFLSEGQEQYIRAMINPETRESGGAVYLKQEIPHQKAMIAKAYGFSSELSDHTEIATANSTHPTLPLQSDQYREIILPDIWDIELLYKIHRYATRKIVGDQILWLPGMDNSIDALRHTLLKPAKAIEQQGLMRLDETQQRYVPTWKGALIMTWQELWPLKWLRQYQLKKLAKALLQASG